jgi:hypothetical protein
MASHPLHVASDEPGISSNVGNMTSPVGLNTSTAPSWEIFCLVVGEDTPFSVEIPSDATVSKLKKAIKAEKARFAIIDTDRLVLYHVRIVDDDELVDKVNLRLNTQPKLAALRATVELSALFQETPAKRTVHILVQPPPGEFLCWY